MTCPTPDKRRYATVEAAELEARRAQISAGRPLAVYLCDPSCGWYHLTKRDTTSAAAVDLNVVRLVASLDDTAFAGLVARDIRSQAHPAEAAALRQPQLLTRWATAISQFQISIEAQFAAKGGDRSPEATDWRKRASHLRFAAAARRKEARVSISARSGNREWATEARRENWLANQEAKARNDADYAAAGLAREEQKRLSREAGDQAVQRLVEMHRNDFNRLLIEECERRRCLPPRALRDGAIQVEPASKAVA
ncbi:hypothetical protein AB0O20_06685 [Streptomyces kronopolitis]|uniref:hypothetical protein n=1 Tax=Streptomyces kronopolitis TaxID=1612435 RepID=UPI00342FD336